MSPLTPPKFYLKVYIGDSGAPVSKELVESLTSAEVTLTDTPPSGFQLVFSSQPSSEDNDYDLMKEPLFDEFNRVVLEMLVDEQAQLLMDGFIVNKELDQSAGKVTLTGEDLSVKMDLIELSKSYPEKTDSAIVNEVLARYASLGCTTEVTAPASEVTPVKHTPQQLSTDRDFLLRLAARNDSRFYIKFDTSAVAYWGPPELDLEAQPALVSDAVVFGNTDKLEPLYDPLAGVIYYGSKLADGDDGKESVLTPFGSSAYGDTALAKTPVPLADYAAVAADPESFESALSTLKIKGKYLRHQHLNPGRVAAAAQSATDLAARQATAVEGELNTERYGHVLKVPGIVGVRGTGEGFDGKYYVQSVTHKMNLKRGEVQYMQSFKLIREGLGAAEAAVEPS